MNKDYITMNQVADLVDELEYVHAEMDKISRMTMDRIEGCFKMEYDHGTVDEREETCEIFITGGGRTYVITAAVEFDYDCEVYGGGAGRYIQQVTAIGGDYPLHVEYEFDRNTLGK